MASPATSLFDRNFRPLALAALVLLGASGSAQAETRSITYTRVDGWTVEAVYDVPSNTFSFCSAAATYRDATYFMITVDSGGHGTVHV